MGQGEENDRPGKAASVSCGQWLSQLAASSPASPSCPGAALLDRNPGSLLGPDTLLAAEDNIEDYVLQSVVFRERGFNPTATNPTSCYSCDLRDVGELSAHGNAAGSSFACWEAPSSGSRTSPWGYSCILLAYDVANRAHTHHRVSQSKDTRTSSRNLR